MWPPHLRSRLPSAMRLIRSSSMIPPCSSWMPLRPMRSTFCGTSPGLEAARWNIRSSPSPMARGACTRFASLRAMRTTVPTRSGPPPGHDPPGGGGGRAFTPDGDGINDGFVPIFNLPWVDNYEFLIFDRWGERLFTSTTPGEVWDGNYHGVAVESEVYVWELKYRDMLSRDFGKAKGHVTVLR
ncbi:MAG: gliding motility-associated C-terminal domain-containing protein [Flavobacteriales bacterium]|nr:gliding motility-associated C-terminal domain-containing protein [Flavobacteriales bacterium]